MLRDDPTKFAGSIPDYYDKGLGPVIFAEPAEIAARRVASKEPSRVLETAAGTGVVTRRMRDALPAAAEIVATDLNTGMVEVARAKFRPDENVTLQVADAMALPFADGEFDAVLCQFGVMFFPDKDKAYREVRRVLAPGAHYVFTVWDSLEHNAFARINADAMRSAFNVDPPPFMAVPFGYAAIDPIKASLLANGFDDLRVDLVRRQGPIADFDRFADGLVHGSPLADQIRSRGGEPEKLQRTVAQMLRAEFGETKSARLQFIRFDARRA
jgi:SAM-dependent methyltransferase